MDQEDGLDSLRHAHPAPDLPSEEAVCGIDQVLVDSHGRRINSIRISVNRECNLACFYCHNEGMPQGLRSMTVDEIGSLADLSSKMGIRKAKLTGGEPLLREDIVRIVERLSPLFEEVSMTTNAVGLAHLAHDLADAGLARVNISLHSLRPDGYRSIAGLDLLEEALAGIDAALEADLSPVKLNMVLLSGINDDEVPDMIRFAAEKGAILQVIEMETERERISSDIYARYHASLEQLREWLLTVGRSNGFNPLHNREKYIVKRLPDGSDLPAPVEVELVMPMHNSEFCNNCHRIRLTAGGQVKGCLFDRECVEDLVTPLQEGAGEEELKDLILRVLADRRPYWTDDNVGLGPRGRQEP
ncbi:MAG: GTP 3',8-cyclase MoaA [Candidatus Thermoplasmatota archaeon]|nr:GTP 3',8-cyclase MoaA [Candidatus Thermoplasmatota archaeon]